MNMKLVKVLSALLFCLFAVISVSAGDKKYETIKVKAPFPMQPINEAPSASR